jgi:hypothetical protein
VTGTVYLIHFDRPYKHARHYLGWSADPARRWDRHTAGAGSRLMAVIGEAGIGWRVTRVWVGSRAFERRLKQRKESPRLCPVCRPEARVEQAERELLARLTSPAAG